MAIHDYHRRRAQQELEQAERSNDPAVKAIHLDLASRYATLGELADREESTLQVSHTVGQAC